ncbi:MAG: trypsin-like peptidase domain-containing protein, partial [Flavobacteriales bacterium]|nr:trypsin-like peptidase domain-containing protein [Flavobacteriales bacterium]
MKRITQLVLTAMAGGLFALGTFYYLGPKPASEVRIVNNGQAQFASNKAQSDVLPDLTTAAEQSLHGVVHIQTIQENKQSYQYDPFRDLFYGRPYYQEAPQVIGQGSGVIVSGDGYIVTNNHVVDGADQIMVTLNDKRSYQAEVVGTDPTTDLALIKIPEKNLAPIPYGNSDRLRIGEWVLAVGNPFNLTSTVTAGIVSAKGRNINILADQFAIESFIQTDAAVN